LNILVKKVK